MWLDFGITFCRLKLKKCIKLTRKLYVYPKIYEYAKVLLVNDQYRNIEYNIKIILEILYTTSSPENRNDDQKS